MAWRRPAHLLLLARVLGHGVVAFTWTAPFFAAEIWLKFRKMLQQWQNTATNVPVAPKQRTAPLGVSWSNCLKPSLVQGPPEKALRCEDQAWPVHATVACLLVHYCRVFNLRVNSGFCIDRNPTRRPEPTSEFLKDWVRHSRMASELCLAHARPQQAWIRRAVREAWWTGASFRLCPLAQAEWLQKTAEEIQKFGVDEALRDVSCLKLPVCVACRSVTGRKPYFRQFLKSLRLCTSNKWMVKMSWT